MKKLRSALSLFLTLILAVTAISAAGTIEASAASYPKIPALQISRVYQPHNDNELCYWASMATVQGYCLGSYTYDGITTNYRIPGQDYNFLDSGDAITKFFDDTADGYANNKNNLEKYYPVKMTRVTEGIGKNAATYQAIYNQLSLGKPVIIYTGTHASVVIGYNGSDTTLEASGFTVLEIKKDKANTSSGYWWVNSATYFNKHANNPQIDSATLSTNGTSYMSCYVNLKSWIEYCGNKVQEICYPTNAVSNESLFSFDANGAAGTMSDMTVSYGNTITSPETTYKNEGYTFAGYNVYRESDGKWYCNAAGWQTAVNIRTNNYEKKVYSPGETYGYSAEWLKDGGVVGTGFIFQPIWTPLHTSLDFYGNYSGTNYMMSLNSKTFAEYYQSRDTSVYTLSVEEGRNSPATLVIEGKSAGNISNKDLLFKTQTNQSPNYNYHAGDNKAMTLTFRAKSSVEGAKMYFRWGYTADTISVTLSTQWKEYSIDMSKQPNDGAYMHPYFDTAGTFYLSDIVLCDKGAELPYEAETSDLLYSAEFTVGSTYGNLPTPQRDGYTFKGWYTSKSGGAKITKNTVVLSSSTAVYARWIDAHDTGIVILGDTDLSGVVNVKDATLIQKGLAGISALSAKETFCGNVISTDVLNVRDATAIQKWCAGMSAGDASVNITATYMPGN